MRRAVLSLLVALSPIFCHAEEPVKVGEALRVRPEVTAEPPKQEKQMLKPKGDIHEGTRVNTAPQAGTAILFNPTEGPRGLVQLGSRTRFTFDSRTISDVIEGRWSFTVDVGKLLAMFSPETATDEHRISITAGKPGKTATVRLYGTAVYLDVAPDGSMYLAVLEGRATVESPAGSEPVPVDAGEQTTIAPGQTPTGPVPFNEGLAGAPDLRGAPWILEPPLIDLNDPRLNLPK